MCDVFAGETLPYATNTLAAEVILVFLLAGVEALRLFFGKYHSTTILHKQMKVVICHLFCA